MICAESKAHLMQISTLWICVQIIGAYYCPFVIQYVISIKIL